MITHNYNYRCKPYPPSILIVGDNVAQIQKLKQKLENNDCHVCWIDSSFDDLAAVCRGYFDLIVIDLEYPDLDSLQVCKHLKTNLKLTNAPIVMLTLRDDIEDIMNELEKSSPVYHIFKDASFEVVLLETIEQIHYLTYRYMQLR